MTQWMHKILRATFRNGEWSVLHMEDWILKGPHAQFFIDNRINEDATLYIYGEAGWELVSVVTDGDERSYYLKRPKE